MSSLALTKKIKFMEPEKPEVQSASSDTKDPYNRYDLEKLIYKREYDFQDLFPENYRGVRYDRYSHSNIYDGDSSLPVWAHYLQDHGYKSVWKVFKHYNLDDCEQKTEKSYGGVVNQFFRALDLYLTNKNRDTLHCAFRQARNERLDVKNVLGNTDIVFSANPWDIATMSMRGITSCMSWQNGHASHLAGSILDPYCGIIALTTNVVHRGQALVYGKKMIARSVVRLIKNKKNYKLLLERVYTGEKTPPPGKQTTIQQAFKNYLSSKTSLPIIEPYQLGQYVIPYFKELPSLAENVKSYRDSHINYGLKDEADEK